MRILALATALVLGACATSDGPEPGPDTTASGTGKVKIGKPYRVGGRWYHPEHDPDYDKVGVASWYGRQFHGRQTANGERFNMNALTAAHPTLPMPSLVRVTNLENGRSIKLRINDRGPFAKGRIIDVSRRAAQLLGFEKQGVARVRVQVIGEDGRPGGRQRAAERPPPREVMAGDAPGPVARPPEVETARLPASRSWVYIQVGAFQEFERARQLSLDLKDLGTFSIQPIEATGARIYRLRLGPYATREEAQIHLDRLRARGFPEARIFSDKIG